MARKAERWNKPITIDHWFYFQRRASGKKMSGDGTRFNRVTVSVAGANDEATRWDEDSRIILSRFNASEAWNVRLTRQLSRIKLNRARMRYSFPVQAKLFFRTVIRALHRAFRIDCQPAVSTLHFFSPTATSVFSVGEFACSLIFRVNMEMHKRPSCNRLSLYRRGAPIQLKRNERNVCMRVHVDEQPATITDLTTFELGTKRSELKKKKLCYRPARSAIQPSKQRRGVAFDPVEVKSISAVISSTIARQFTKKKKLSREFYFQRVPEIFFPR